MRAFAEYLILPVVLCKCFATYAIHNPSSVKNFPLSSIKFSKPLFLQSPNEVGVETVATLSRAAPEGPGVLTLANCSVVLDAVAVKRYDWLTHFILTFVLP